MEFLPTHAVRQEMLTAIGLDSVEDLFADIPKSVRIQGLNLPTAKSELEVIQYLKDVLAQNQHSGRTPSFVGGTLKEHHVPAFVAHLLSRQEFYTAYTPYQPELAQGILQALFEFQSLAAEILSMDVVNASMYDASTALAEAVLMSHRVNGRRTILVPQHMAPEKRSVLANYASAHEIRLQDYPFDAKTGRTDVAALTKLLDNETSAVILENPNFFGQWESEAAAITQAAHDAGALAILGFDLSSLGIAAPPGALGADIAVGDGTTFCFPPSLGGPQLGVFACRLDLARRMPGRLIGASRDMSGRRAYCMTLQTREQHIRREKATSNICTNQALLAVGAGAHLAALGGKGLRDLGVLNAEAAHRLADLIEDQTEWRLAFEGPFYNEFTITGPADAERVFDTIGKKGVTPGFPASRAVKGLSNHLVVCSTEIHTPADHERLVALLKEAS
jgi:glycine dehydrogenase subunit 1